MFFVYIQIALVEEGFASVHPTAEKSEYYKQLKQAEDSAKLRRLRIWQNYEEEKEEEQPTEDSSFVSVLFCM